MVLLRSTVTLGNVLRCNTIFCDFCCFLRMITRAHQEMRDPNVTWCIMLSVYLFTT